MLRFGLFALAALATSGVSVHAQSASSSTGTYIPGGGGYPYYGTAGQYPQADTDASFCDRLVSSNNLDYTNPDHAFALMYILVQRSYNGAVVNGSAMPPILSPVQGLVNNKNTITFFDGTIDYRNSATSNSPYKGTATPNIRYDKAAALALDDKLTRFLGVGFGCTGGPVGAPAFQSKYPYTVQSMTAIHSGMQITQTQFDAFINQFSDSAKSLGATDYDFNLNVVPFLQSFGRGAIASNGICNDASCACATGFTGSDCSSRDSSTGVVVNPGQGPTPADLGAASAVQAGVIGFVLAAVATIVTML